MRLFFFFLALLAVSCTSLRSRRSASFTPAERTTILSADTNQPMRVFKITQPADSVVLRQRSLPVVPDPQDPVLAHFIARLYRTVRDPRSLGVGIAAPQVGILRQIIWVQRFDKEGFPFEAYLNPVIRQYSTLKQPCLEGCLSIPNRRDTTRNRAYAILLEYDRPSGEHVVEMVEDFTAVIFQHEVDHLNGILFTDHLQAEIEAGE